ncbi:polysaccharide pyruvyl transferase family protein [Alteromonas sp. A081]|uniref:polysaccharide pyruvyl transferase family protein n=1 Tax=Alteromonas sp. A081 TaxID=3410269 RepID=UPI003B984CAE
MNKRHIATMTLPLHNNYGGLLQAFALQHVIQELGHETKLIRNDLRHYPLWKKRFHFLKHCIKKVVFKTPILVPDFTTKEQKKIIAKNSESFIEKNINTTSLVKNVFSFNDIKNYNFDGFVVGSDQVWRTDYSANIVNYFFEFLDSKPNMTRVSYAASFGIDEWTFSDEETQKCKKLISNFHSVSVREESAVELCKIHLAIDAERVLDPTFLVQTGVYRELVDKANLQSPEGKIFSYVLDRSDSNKKIEREASQKLNTKHFTIMPRKDLENLNSENIDEFVYPAVENWINGFIQADYVITDSFHGTVFAILFNKKFISIGNRRRGLSRFVSILSLFGLESRLVTDYNDFSVDKLTNDIDWNYINKILSIEQEHSKQFLKNSLDY